MNYRLILQTIGKILLIEALLMVFPLVVNFIYQEENLFAFALTISISMVVGTLLMMVKPKNKSMFIREGFVIVGLAWIVMSLFGALPFTLSGEIPHYIDALFETISGFTTTGASILNDVEAMSKSMLFWRSFTHWIGGMGVLVFVLCILPLADGNNMHLMRAESPGPSVGKLVPKMRSTAMILYGIYAALTVVEGILLLFGGMSLFDAVTTSLATAGTGGFGIKNNSMADYSMYIQNVVAVFMFIFGVNFNIYFLMLVRKPKEILQSEELKTYLGIVLVATVVIALNISGSLSSIWVALQQAFFQVTAIITTTGFSTVDFNHWPELSKFILVGLMFMGGCAGSTSGGIKISRIIIAWKNLKNEISSFVHPKRVQVIRLEGRKVGNDVVKSVNAYFVLYALLFIGSMFLICIENGSFETNFTAIAATLNNVGPGLAGVGPMENFGGFSPLSKCVFMFGMLAGRLELIPMIILFSPWIWKNKRSNKKKSLKEAI